MEEVIDWKKFLLPYEQAVDELKVKLESLVREYKINGQPSPIEQVHGRVKRISSILDKAAKKKISVESIDSKIEDIAGLRVICRFVEDIDRVIHLIRERGGHDMKILQERDYVTNAKPSGYRSYHLIIEYPVITSNGYSEILAEIQIRTLAMNFWATTEHSMKYKYSGNIPNGLKERLCAAAEAAFKLDKEMGTIRHEILEAQQIVQTKTDLVDEILSRIQNLHYVTKLDRVNELNKQFFELYEEDNIDKLNKFNQQLKVMVEAYKFQFV